MVVQRTPRSDAVRPTRRAISPRLAIRTEVMGVAIGAVGEECGEVIELVVDLCRNCVLVSMRLNARDLEACNIMAF
jgi:hypothetical protein